MPDLSPHLIAALTGFIFGLVLCLPVGPVNLAIVEGARRGFRWAALIGLGATTMEVIYCAIAFTSFAAFFQKGVVKSVMEVFSFAFMLFLGVRFLVAKPGPVMEKLEHRFEERLEEKLHPHSAFMIGFVRTLANPAVLIGWIVLGANFISRGWVEPNWSGKLSCLAGVATSIGMWFTGLSWAVSVGHRKYRPETMRRLEQVAGVGLIVFALFHGTYIAMNLAKHKM
jgi:threonine/homoserine/homoserine lactone efflux protein